MTERGRDALARTAADLSIGPSSLTFDGGTLTIAINEVTAPIPARLEGVVRVHLERLTDRVFQLDRRGLHHWQPLAPVARIEVAMSRPSVRWSGSAYLDNNTGDGALEDAFTAWTWTRLSLAEETAVFYDASWRGGEGCTVALHCLRSGFVEDIAAPAPVAIPATRLWRMPRALRAENGKASLVRTLEDTPFYARSLIAAQMPGEAATGVHESLSLDRFVNPVVQAMLPFRMPRRSG
jgi:carotenoid 1,2-hydratase